jgi:putative transcriptional regulator
MSVVPFNGMTAEIKRAKKHHHGNKTNARESRAAFQPAKLKPEQIRRIRTQLGFSQPQFAKILGISVWTVRTWEQGSREPRGAAALFLAIAKHSLSLLILQGNIQPIGNRN